MPIKLTSSQVRRHFGRAIDQAVIEDDVIVERYGMPRVVLVKYGRYQRLVEAERALLSARLRQASAAASALPAPGFVPAP